MSDETKRVSWCELCGNTQGVKPEPSRTKYHWDGTGEDPNADVMLCRECAMLHHLYWDEVWADVLASLL